VPLEKVVGTGQFDFVRAARSPGWLAELRGEHTPETEEYRIGSFVYRARRPFHPARFAEAIKNDWRGNVMRSKGFFWLASRPHAAGEWAQAGGIVRHGPAGIWWADAPRQHWPDDTEQVALIEAEFQGEFGDRRQEIVFIGQNLEEDHTRETLDSCLLDDAEMAMGMGMDQWKHFEDPFPRWFASEAE